MIGLILCMLIYLHFIIQYIHITTVHIVVWTQFEWCAWVYT